MPLDEEVAEPPEDEEEYGACSQRGNGGKGEELASVYHSGSRWWERRLVCGKANWALLKYRGLVNLV